MFTGRDYVMDSIPPTTANDGEVVTPSMVDPFLVEALQNPRHRLTILRMELDIQKFFQNSDQQQFEFQHFPTSYLRLAAHRVAQHYGLQTMVQDNVLNGLGTRIVVKKLAESRYPAICLSEIPAKQLEHEKHDHIKIVMRPRHNKDFSNGVIETGVKRSSVRTVEERKEDYDRARARIFSCPPYPMLEEFVSQENMGLSGDENEGCKNSMIDSEKDLSVRDGGTSSRVAIFRDREKDRTDPDYDRSYERYVKNVPANQTFNMAPLNMQKFQPTFVQYDTGVPQLGQMPRTHASLSYSAPIMSPFCPTGFNQTSRDAVYMQWPTSAMMYAQSYEQVRHAVFQAPYCQQPLSFDYSQNH
ncbi:R3H domain-containing protein [Actinidia chinensis var. chinensis]|uniref:R3H domain-containing protein n=1 Tax=Actinidia chinensis var. chinensis TaxID=1590841 RepID=A0A2R6RU12_ACTCC|nr:R3H domain-containing protein [Actinidia chinensis var. chinensis]